MKNKTLILTKTLIKNGEGLGLKGNKKNASTIFLILLLAFTVPAMGILFTLFLSSAYDVLAMMGQEGVIISWGISINSIVIFMFGIFYIISSFYFSSDVENLLHLPLRPRQIVGAKFLVITIYEYLITAVVFLPILLVYGIKAGEGILYYFYGLITFALIPIVPLAVAAVITMIIMRFTNATKYRDAFKVAGGLIGIAFGLGINVVIQRMTGNLTQGQIEEMLLRGDNSLVAITSGIFPTVRYAVRGILESSMIAGLFNMLIYVVISIVVFIALIYLGELLYFKGVVGISETGSRRNRVEKLDMNKSVVKGSVIWTYVSTEVKLLFRTPIYFLNCVLINFIWPLFLLFPILTQTGEDNFFLEIGQLLREKEHAGVILAVAFAIIMFLGGTNTIAPTAISREGQQLFIKKYIPVSYKKQITAKIISACIMGEIGVIMMVILALVIFRLPIYLGLIILALGWIPILFTSFTGILIDLYNPKLDWDNEQKAVKQNFNLVFNMILGMALAGITGVGGVLLGLNTGIFAVIGALVILYGGLTVILYFVVYTRGAYRFSNIEV